MEDYFKNVDRIIKTRIRKYGGLIKNYDYADLLQEGRLAALEALRVWEVSGKEVMIETDNGKNIINNKASVLYWAKIYITCRFKTILSNGSNKDSSLEEMEYEIPRDKIFVSLSDIESFVHNSIQPVKEKPAVENKMMANSLLKSLPEKQAPVMTRLVENGLSQKSTGKLYGKSRHRINQIKREAMKNFDSKESNKKTVKNEIEMEKNQKDNKNRKKAF